MIIKYIKQAISQIKQQPIISAITIIGTAMAIFLIMLVVMMQEVKVAPYSPESNRDRFLHVKYMCARSIDDNNGGEWNGPFSLKVAKECFKSLKTPKAVSIYSIASQKAMISAPTKTPNTADLLNTDDSFWTVFDFDFITGKPFNKAQFDSGIPVVVISESVAKKNYGTTDVIGKELDIQYLPYKIVGVVKDVSILATCSYAQIWIPYTSSDVAYSSSCKDLLGMMSVTILANNRSDFPKIREEVNKRREIFNASIKDTGWKLFYRDRPYDQEKSSIFAMANEEPDIDAKHNQYLLIFAILLLVPAINLSSMTHSNLNKRIIELGVRRAFGSTRFEIINLVMIENMIITLIAGIIGLILSLIFAFFADNILFMQMLSFTDAPVNVDSSILIHPSTFLYAILFCFILNVLSSGIPAFKASRINIVYALTGRISK